MEIGAVGPCNRCARMDKPRRVVKTLACLVGAMTGTTTLLGWIDPSHLVPPEGLAPGELVLLARSVVGDPGRININQWEEVEVTTGSGPTGTGRLLAARSHPSHYHFHIDAAGRPVHTSRWQEQQSAWPGSKVVRIEVADRGAGLPWNAAQMRCVQVVVSVLDEILGDPETDLPVRWGTVGSGYLHPEGEAPFEPL